MTPTTTHTKGAGEIQISELVIGSRYRKDTPEVRQRIADNLVPTIAEHGLIKPLIVRILPDGKLELVDGWRRSVAMSLLGHTHAPFVFRDAVDEVDAAQLEIEANQGHEDPPFSDTVRGIARVHKLRIKAGRGTDDTWSVRKTGDLLNVSAGSVSELLQAAELLEAGDTEIKEATTLLEVRRILHRRAADKLSKVLAERRKQRAQTQVQAEVVVETKKVQLVGDDDATRSIIELLEAPTFTTTVPISKWLLNMDCHDWFAQRADESVDLIHTDIPYGINMADLEDMVDVERVSKEHDVDENIAQFEPFIKSSARVLRQGSYLIFYYALEHDALLRSLLTKHGFTVQKWPLLWLKPGAKNNAMNTWWTKAVEYMMVARKGTATLLKPQPLCYKYASAAAEKKVYLHKFYKPWDITRWVLEAVLRPHMVMLDPYMGESSIIRVALEMGAEVIGIEKVEAHYLRAVDHIREQVRRSLQGNVIFT